MNLRLFGFVCACTAEYLVAFSTAYAASFTGLGDLPGGRNESHAQGISADGFVVVGVSQSANEFGFSNEAFRWTEADNMSGIGFLETGATFSSALGVSATGTVVVGTGEVIGGNEPFRWTRDGGMVGLGDLGGVNSNGLKDGVAESTSADGSVVVGKSISPSGTEAFRWTEADKMMGLGDLEGGDFFSEATAVSANGQIIVGQSRTDVGREGFVWTRSGKMQGLGMLEGDLESVARGISDDGTTIVGWSGLGGITRREAVRWTPAGEVKGLGDLGGGDFYSEARDASANGAVIVGLGRTELGTFAFIWDASNGMRNLQELLVNDYGLDLTGWNLFVATAVSEDGLTIVGDGRNPDGRTEAWMVRLDPTILGVTIDIKPGSDPNAINVRSKGKIPVAILTTDDFDATTVDATTVQFGPGLASPVKYRHEDVGSDGDWDLMLHFKTQEAGIACDDTEAVLTGQTFDGADISGTDSVKTVGCKKRKNR